MKYLVFILLISLIACSGNSENIISENENKTTDTTTAEIIDEPIDSNILALQPERFEKFADSLTKGKCTINTDSVVSENLVKTTYNIIEKESKRLYTWYEIFHFKNDSLATDFFIDLKTQEMIQPFGIDKRPKHILVNGNIVIFHHMEHSYGHRYKEINNIFNATIGLKKNASNLDSISGFIYCTCHHKEADITPLLGKWESVKTITIYTDTSDYHNKGDTLWLENPRKISVYIYKDSVRINEMVSELHYPPTSIELPDVYYFMKYRFLERPPYRSMIVTDAMKNESEKIQKTRLSYIIYDFYLKTNRGIDILQLKNKTTYLVYNNRLYRLKRVSGA